MAAGKTKDLLKSLSNMEFLYEEVPAYIHRVFAKKPN